MKIKVIVHEAEEGGYWAEVPAIPGCATQGETRGWLLLGVSGSHHICLLGGAERVGNLKNIERIAPRRASGLAQGRRRSSICQSLIAEP
jgi:hypothetical protein